MNRIQTLHLTDCTAALTFLACVGTGFARHGASHGICSADTWGAGHTAASLLFAASICAHIYQHRSWYKLLFKNGLRGHRTAAMLLSLLFAVVTVTGLVLLGGAGTATLGLPHYQIGILFTILALAHTFRRRRALFRKIGRAVPTSR